MSKPKPPAAPDPIKTGAAQTGTNIGTSIANQIGGMVGQNTPYGNLSYGQTGSYTFTDPTSGQSYNLPTFTATQTLTPAGQRIHDATMGTQQNLANLARDQSGRLGGLLDRPMDMSGVTARGAVPGMQTVGQAGQLQGTIADAGGIRRGYEIADRGRVEEALMSRMNPQLAQDRAALENQLRQQGLTVGSAGYDRAMANANQQSNDARMQAILAGGQEQSRMTALNAGLAGFGNDAQAQAFAQNAARTGAFNAAQQGNFQNRMAGAGFDNAAAMDAFRAQEAQRAASLGEAYQQRNQPINEITALMNGSQLQAPSFVNAPGLNVPTTDYAGLIQQNYANQMGAYGQQMNNWNGLWGGLMGAAGNIGMGMLSDARAKKDIRRIGTADNGLPLYTFRYRDGGPVQVGVIAQDLLRLKPEAVYEDDGLLHVDYAEAFA